MCKLLIMTGITEGLVAQEFMRRMAVPMSRTNSHGIGYTAVGPDGELFSQRWLNNDQFFDTRDVMTPEIAEALQPYVHRLPKGALDNNYSEMGTIDFENVKTVTMHTRFATCGREFANTHPFIYEDTSLIHNGTIRNAFTSHYSTSYSTKGLDVNKISTCDSEAALQTYLSQGVNLDIKQAKGWLDLLSGSWAFGILTRNQQGNRVLDVVRGTSSLYYMEIDGLGKVFTTDDDDAKAVVKDMGLTFVTAPYLLAMDEMYRYDTVTGGMLEKGSIKTVYNSNSGNSYSKTRGRSGTTTGATGTSNSPETKTSTTQSTGSKKPGVNLIAMLDSLRDEPDFMSCFPDIFTETSTKTNLHLDFRKVTKHVNDLSIPLIDRLDVFDLVYNSTFRVMYETFPHDVRDFVRQMDNNQGLKSARKIIKEVYEKRTSSIVG